MKKSKIQRRSSGNREEVKTQETERRLARYKDGITRQVNEIQVKLLREGQTRGRKCEAKHELQNKTGNNLILTS